jgi:LAO/AO transport system kinase
MARPAAPGDVDRIAEDFRARRVRGLARAISLVERRSPSVRDLLDKLDKLSAMPPVVGLTGAPGSGKSTLADALIAFHRRAGRSVAVIAVDPNSPFSGGAVFGDRVRMSRHSLDAGVYIRSMGARGHLGGLAVATREAIRLAAAFGFDVVFVETVGVGQSELEIAGVADTTLVVMAPGLGDDVQMIKAGIMEIADVFVVNKADTPGYERTVRQLRAALNLGPKLAWKPPIVATVASRGEGVDELWGAVEKHREFLARSGEGERRAAERLREEAADLVGEWARDAARRLLHDGGEAATLLDREGAPYGAAEFILREKGPNLIPETKS